MPNFGRKVVGEKAYTDAVKNEAGGGAVFGTRVRSAITGSNVENEAKRNSEFGPRPIIGTHDTTIDSGIAVEELDQMLANNSTTFDSLYEAELAREEGPRAEALAIFLSYEHTGVQRPHVIRELRELLGLTAEESAVAAERAQRALDESQARAKRQEENAALADMDRLKAITEREELVKKAEKASHTALNDVKQPEGDVKAATRTDIPGDGATAVRERGNAGSAGTPSTVGGKTADKGKTGKGR